MDRRADLALALVIAVIGVGILLVAGDIRPTGPVVDPIGPRAFPYAIGAILLVAGAILSVTGARALIHEGPIAENSDGEPDEPGVPASASRAWCVMALTVAYVLLLSRLGYPLATPVYVAGALLLMGMRSGPVIAAVAIGYTAATYVVFAMLMRVTLPLGPLETWFRAAGLAR